MFLSNTQWYATRCKKELPYICEVPDRVDENEPKAPIKLSKHVETSTPTTTPTPIVKFVNKEVKVVIERCDSKWTYYNLTNSCYKVNLFLKLIIKEFRYLLLTKIGMMRKNCVPLMNHI